jgi:hypothetical protein
MVNRKQTLPAWSYPLVLVLLGIVIAVGHLPLSFQIGVAVETLLFIGYLVFRSRRALHESWAVANLLPLFPGHLLLLFALAVVDNPGTLLLVVWMAIPLASILYDTVASRRWTRIARQMSLLAGLYCIIWAALFVILERVIALGREIQGSGEIWLIVVFGFVGVVFLAAGVYRHWYAVKSSKE